MSQKQSRYQAGEKIGGRYVVYKALLGGMGEVYLSLDNQTQLPYALKTFQGIQPHMRELFESEVKTWMNLGKHPNIVRCHWMELADNIPFMLLEWVVGDEEHGIDLRSWVRKGALSLKQSLKFAIDIAYGLDYAGQKVAGIIHRDLKPDNVLVAQGGLAKITDFGLATIIQKSEMELPKADELSEESSHQSIRHGHIVGTPAYMPPEQWHGDADIDVRADIYAVGCILYEMLTGRMPYVASTLKQLRLQHLDAPIPHIAHIPEDINTIIQTCMAKKRDNRYPTIKTLLDALLKAYDKHIGESFPCPTAETLTDFDYNGRGYSYNHLHLYDLAIRDFEEAIRLNPENYVPYTNLGMSYCFSGQNQKAIEIYNKALRLNPLSVAAYMNRAISYDALGRTKEALEDYSEAIRLNPDFEPSYYNRGNLFQRIGNDELAIADYDMAVKLNPTHATAYNNLAICHYRLGHIDEALANFDEALHQNPTLVDAYVSRGSVYGQLGYMDKAIADFNSAIYFNPTVPVAYLNRGVFYSKVGEYEKARIDYEKATTLNPNWADAWFKRASVCANLQRHQEALNYLEKAKQLGHPQADEAIAVIHEMLQPIPPTPPQSTSDTTYPDVTAQVMQGVIYQYSGQHGEAIKLFTQAIALNPTDTSAYNSRGNCYHQLGYHQQAIADYDIVVQLSPDNPDTYFNRANSYMQIGQYDRALMDLNQAIRMNPNDSSNFNSRGLAYANLKQFDKAQTDYEQALRLEPNHIEALFNFGLLLANTNRLQEALVHLEKAYQLGDTESLKLITQIKQLMAGDTTSYNPQLALEAFQQVTTLDEMRQTVAKYPVLTEPTLIQAIQQIIQTQIPPHLKPDFDLRLVWLKQIAKGD